MDHETLVAQSIEDLQLKTGLHDRVWNLTEADWSVDQDAGEIVFTAPDGIVATCPVQIIGTFNSEESTWLWGWDHPSVPPQLRRHAERLRQYGEQNGIAEYTTRKLETEEDACWDFTALACMLNDAQGGYRGPSGNTFVFMTFGRPQLSGNANGLEAPSVRTTPVTPPGEFTSEIPADVRDTVTGFITALHQWSVESYRAYEKDDSDKTRESIRRKYRALMERWCIAEVTPQGLSFSGDPSHNPETEMPVSAAVGADQCWVRTEHTERSSVHEYQLRRVGGKWLVEHLFYVDDEIRYECL